MPDELPEDNFSEAFDQLTQLQPDAAPPAPPAPAAEETPPPPAEEASPVDETPPAPVDETPPAPVDETPPAPTPPVDDVLDRLADLVSKKAPPAAEPTSTPAPAAEEAPPAYTPEEEQLLSEYEKDWPDVARAEALRRRGEYQQLVGYVFREFAKEVGPMMETLQSLAQRTMYADLTAEVTDYEDVRDKVVDWVGTQPAYLQAAYNHVIQRGTVDEVKDLIQRYREASGMVASAPAAQPTKKETELPPATKQAAASLAPVSSKRTVVPQEENLNDFEGAFATFAGILKP